MQELEQKRKPKRKLTNKSRYKYWSNNKPQFRRGQLYKKDTITNLKNNTSKFVNQSVASPPSD